MMKIQEIISHIKQEDMHELSAYYEEMMDQMKECDYSKYSEIYLGTYALAYGYKLNEDLACWKVKCMKPYGEHWTIEQTTSVGLQYSIDFDKIGKATWYYVMNMMYNDYYTVLGSDTTLYIKMSKAWLEDVDSPYSGDEKTFRYAMM